MVFKEILICDVCGKELTQREWRRYSLSLHAHNELVKQLGEGYKTYWHRGRRYQGELEVDLCSPQCLIKFLEEVKKMI